MNKPLSGWNEKRPGKNIPIILLAAGSSSRLGRPKQLLPFQGETLLHRIARQALESQTGPVIIVLGSESEQIKSAVQDLPVHCLFHHDWNKGIGSSIKAGINYVYENFPFAPAVIISVSDQPFLKASHFEALKNKFLSGGHALVASHYAETHGVPCLFSARFFTALHALTDEQGASQLISHHQNEMASVSFPEGDQDIDTLADWEMVTKNLR